MFEVRAKPDLVERAFLIGAYFRRDDVAEAESLLEELSELVDSLGIGIVGRSCIFVRDPNRRYLTGSGKAAELIEEAKALHADCIIFDNSLSPMQQRAWETEGNVCVIDREEVILDIFNERARTREAQLQVELARMEYSLPRLARMWAHLDRQGGGTGGGKGGGGAARGEGEKQIEVDRRIARRRIDRVREELEAVRQVRQTQRKERTREGMPLCSIVGYTNAGKSSLLNQLSGSTVLAEDKLFATLDPTTRRIQLPDGQPLLLTDTVGFVRNLPTRLVEAFKATLEEAVLADFLIHVLDASAPEISAYYETTINVLNELGAGGKRTVVVLNKCDLIDEERRQDLRQMFGPEAVQVSVKTGLNMDRLIQRLNEMVLDRVCRLHLRIPQSRQDLVSLIHREGKILNQRYEDNDILLTVVAPRVHLHVFQPFLDPNPDLAPL
ncbi:MAG: GTPase HflX [Akkermansiaceae bacterium]|nr:GTPase HflX [Akkermansiaceae bacterium]